MLAGDFTDVMSAQCQGGVNRTLGAPFVGNKIDPALLNPIAMKIAGLLPTSNTDPCGRTRFTVPNDSDEIQTVVRSDYTLTPFTALVRPLLHRELRSAAVLRRHQRALVHRHGAGT